jgi:hypothetical protein
MTGNSISFEATAKAMDSVWRYGCGVALVMECRLSALFPTKWSPVGGLKRRQWLSLSLRGQLLVQ